MTDSAFPVATYRLQLNRDFTFYDAANIVDYLHDLGVSHLYLSPVLESVSGSLHGYDVTDFSCVSLERGGEEGLLALDRKLASMNPPMRLILDIVPNHMAASPENPYWNDVTEKGKDSRYARIFDIYTDDAGQVCGYRRFFAVDSLVGVRVEDEEIFSLTHEKIFQLAETLRSFAGVRVDHIDGLADPEAYLHRLYRKIQKIWVEKVLTEGEAIPPAWPVQGTTGYDFIAAMNAAFVCPENFIEIEKYWRTRVCGMWASFDDCARESKKEVLADLFGKELERVVRRNPGKSWADLAVGLPVYRCYNEGPREWQQLTSAVFAKGVEDGAQYRYTPLVALNEVGCRGVLGKKTEKNHVSRSPETLNTTSTHDTKRSGDMRARLYALCDKPQDWISFYEDAVKAVPPPDAWSGYFFYQTVLGFWPFCGEVDNQWKKRVSDYMIKAAREAGIRTGWSAPDGVYEKELVSFIEKALSNEGIEEAFQKLHLRLSAAGAINALSVLALKTLSGGIPDFYQGEEGWHLALVDPDNRRQVDFAALARRLQEVKEMEAGMNHREFLSHLTDTWRGGHVKTWLTKKILGVRREYGPVRSELRTSKNSIVCLASDQEGKRRLLVVLPRFPGATLADEAAIYMGGVDIRLDIPELGNASDFFCLVQQRAIKYDSGVFVDIFRDFPLAVLSRA